MAKRLVDVNEALELAKNKMYSFTQGMGTLVTLKWLLQDCITIEAKPVVHAHWEEQNDGTHFCSRCGNDATYTYEGKELVGFLCPFCGAQMDEKESD